MFRPFLSSNTVPHWVARHMPLRQQRPAAFSGFETAMRFFTEIQQIIHRVNPACPQSQLQAETALLDQGILDSLQIVAVIGEIENDLGVRIAIEDVIPENFESLSSICRLVDRTLSQQPAAH
jgi:acyl carrier protein